MTPLKAKQENEEKGHLLDILIEVPHLLMGTNAGRQTTLSTSVLVGPAGEYAGHR